MLPPKPAFRPWTRPKTWWWNDQVDNAVQEKCAWFTIYNALQKVDKTAEAKEAETACNDAEYVAKYAV